MKQKTSKLLSIIILFGLFLSLFNCQKEDFEEDLQNKRIPFKMKIINKDSILNNQVLSQKIKTIIGGNSIETDNNRDMIYNSDYGFTINTNRAKYIESSDGTFHSYTFSVKTDLNQGNENVIENLVISLQTDGTYSSEIAIYDISNPNNIELKRAPIEISTDQLINRRALYFSCTTIVTYNTSYNEDCSCEYIEIIDVNTNCTYTSTFNEINPADDGSNGGGGGGGIGNIIWNEGNTTVSSPLVPCSSGGIGFGGSDGNDCVSAEERFNALLCNPVTPEQIDWIFESQTNTDYAQQLLDYLINTTSNGGCNETNFDILIKDIEVMDLLENNPALLLEIDCDQIQHWQDLAQNAASLEIINKLDSLPSSFWNTFAIQTLQNAEGTVVNMDYFSVNIATLPNDPTTGNQFTADEFLNYFRRNINDFSSGSGSSFEPFCEELTPSICQQETDLWNSNDPTGAIIYIDIPLDDGVVICSESHNDYWYFMTLNAPYAGNHPVSGTREFGYEINDDGTYDFFVRGVDRFNDTTLNNTIGFFNDTDPFLASDFLWTTMQIRMNDFVNNNGGDSSIVPFVKNRPDWDKVSDVLQGFRPISDLGCN